MKEKSKIMDPRIVEAMNAEVKTSRRLGRRDLLLAVGTPLAVLLVWELGVRSGLIDGRLFSPPSAIVARTMSMAVSGELLEHLIPTVLRLAAGYGLGVIAGITLGFFMGMWRPLRAALEPTFTALYALPKIAILPLLLLIFGLTETPKILAVMISVFFVIQINTLAGILQIDSRVLEAARAYQATGWKQFRFVILPAATPQIFTGLRVAAGMAVVVVTAIEFVASNSGLGYIIWNSWQLFQPEKMYVGLIVVSLLGAGLTAVIISTEKILLPWKQDSSSKKRQK